MDRRSFTSERLRGAALAGVAVALLAWALLAGLNVAIVRKGQEALATFTVVPPPVPEKVTPPVPPPKPVDAPEGAAAPPNLRSKATEVVAPEPVIPPPDPPPLDAATKAATGSDATSGAAEIAGPGTGAGGSGDGTGAGGSGSGTGSGRQREAAPVRVRGAIRNSDFPPEARRAMRSGTVTVSYYVETDGRASDCRIDRTSGSRDLDIATCELIETRFRFRPATDENGKPVRALLVEDHHWEVR